MRMMMQFTIPVEAGNHAARTGGFGPTMRAILESIKPEAAYFGTGTTGERGGVLVFDLKEASDIPGIAEQLFLAYNAKVTLFPVMTAQDLANAVLESRWRSRRTAAEIATPRVMFRGEGRGPPCARRSARPPSRPRAPREAAARARDSAGVRRAEEMRAGWRPWPRRLQ
jgi:hypothetical protein